VSRYGSVYLVTNTVTSEQYIGQTRQKSLRRWKNHINTANSTVAKKYKLANAINVFGKDNFNFQEVFVAFDADALNAAEIAWIEDIKPAYNITKGGAGHKGVCYSAEVCKARSERLKRQWSNPEWRDKQITQLKEISKTAEARIRGQQVCKIGSAARARHVFCPELQCTFLSVADAAKYLNMSHTGIRYAIANNSKVKKQYTLLEGVR